MKSSSLHRLMLFVATFSTLLVLPTSPASASTTPASPQLSASISTAGSVSFTWSVPTSPVSHTRFELRRNGTLIAANLSPALSSYTASGLSPDTSYVFALRACASLSCSPDASLSLRTAPAAATSVMAVAGPGSLTVSWTSPASAKVLYKTSAAASFTEWTPGVNDVSPTTITGLANGTPHVARVETFNASGSTMSVFTPSLTPRAAPPATALSQTRATTSSVSIGWTAPFANGSSILGYKVYLDGTLVAAIPSSRSYTFTGLTAGKEYVAELEACNAIGCSPKSPPLTILPLPSAPVLQSATPADQSAVLVWSDSASPVVSGHKVLYRAATSTTWIEWTPGVNDVSPTTITGLANGTAHVFTVAAFNQSGPSANAPSRSATPRTIPATPVLNVAASTNSSVDLAWTAPASNGAPITSYQVFNGTSQLVSKVGTTHMVSGLTPGYSYTFKVRACNVAGCGPFGEAQATTLPRAASLRLVRGDTQISVEWTVPTNSQVSSAVFYRSLGSTDWIEWTPTIPDVSPVVVTGLVNGVIYEFKVISTNAVASVDSLVLVASPAGAPMVAPAAVSLSSSDSSSLTVAWSTPANTGGSGVVSFRIYRNASILATVAGHLRSYTFTGLLPGTEYSYQLQFCTSVGCSPVSQSITLATRVAAPSALNPVSTDSELTLTWAPSSGSTLLGYKVYYKLATASIWNVASNGNYVSSPLSFGDLSNAYWIIRVAAVDSMGEVSSGLVSVQRDAPEYVAPPPQALVAVSQNTSVLLSWSAPSSLGRPSLNGYVVHYRPSVGGEWTELAASTSTSRTITGLQNGTSYDFKVYSQNPVGLSTPATAAPVVPMTTPSAPVMTSSDFGHTQVAVFWSAPTSDGGSPLTGYVVEYAVGTGDFSTAALVGPSDTMFGLGGLENGTLYRFRVTAQNLAGSSPVSNVISVTPSTMPGVPRSVEASRKTSTSLLVYWKVPLEDGGSPVSAYEVAYRMVGSTSWEYLIELDYSDAFAEITDLTANASYEVVVSAGNAAGYGATSAPVLVNLAPFSLSYSSTEFSTDSPNQALAPVISNGTAVTIGLNGALPAGVSFDHTNGAFTGPATWNKRAVTVSAGIQHSCAAMSDGSAYCWGNNGSGRLGNGSTSNSSTPVQVSGLTSAVYVGAGSQHSCALLRTGTVYCWGDNEDYQLGNGTSTGSTTPTQVSNISNAIKLSVGDWHSCALLVDQTVRCWGSNIYGRLGNGSGASSSVPVTPTGLSKPVRNLSAGNSSTCVVLVDGTLRCWGSGEGGKLGNGSTDNSAFPTPVSYMDDAVSVAVGGSHACALRVSGAVSCWGGNTAGELGDGTDTQRLTPVPVSNLSSVESINLGTSFSCATLTSGAISCWGGNWAKQIGAGIEDSPVLLPTGVVGVSSASSVDGGDSHACATISDGTLRCWGANYVGQLGTGSISTLPAPVVDIGNPGFPATVSVVAQSSDGDLATTTVTLTLSQTYDVGDTGPGGGVIFYAAAAPFACGANLASTCTYLEAAPADIPGYHEWCSATDALIGTTSAIGTGMKNTTTADAVCTSGAIQLAANYSNNGLSDWFLPSAAELNILYQQSAVVGVFLPGGYWSSTEDADALALGLSFGTGAPYFSLKEAQDRVRPVRSF